MRLLLVPLERSRSEVESNVTARGWFLVLRIVDTDSPESRDVVVVAVAS